MIGDTPSRRRKHVLVAYSASSTHVQTTHDYLVSLSRYLNAEVKFVHVTNDAVMDFDLATFDAVFHSYCARWPFEGHVSAHYGAALAAFRGPKILAVQDEYDRTDKLKQAILDHGFNVVLTCIPQEQIQSVYPRDRFSHVEFITVLTGYVPEDIARLERYALPLSERPTLIGYRGRDIGAQYGALAFDKLEIGRRMREISESRGLPVDIDWTEESRIYGADWLKFLGSCRATLGSESGSNVFDFDGEIARRFQADTARRGRPPSYKEFLPVIAEREALMDMGQISPRVFEAAALRAPMILFTGRYSGVVAPDEHYIELKKDFSNVDAVLERLNDIPALEAMADRAYDHLVASSQFGYPAFVAMVDAVIDSKLAVEPAPSALGNPAPEIQLAEDERALLLERPTDAPAPRHVFDLKHARREALIYRREVRRVEAHYVTETAHLRKMLGPLLWVRAQIRKVPPLDAAARWLSKKISS